MVTRRKRKTLHKRKHTCRHKKKYTCRHRHKKRVIRRRTRKRGRNRKGGMPRRSILRSAAQRMLVPTPQTSDERISSSSSRGSNIQETLDEINIMQEKNQQRRQELREACNRGDQSACDKLDELYQSRLARGTRRSSSVDMDTPPPPPPPPPLVPHVVPSPIYGAKIDQERRMSPDAIDLLVKLNTPPTPARKSISEERTENVRNQHRSRNKTERNKYRKSVEQEHQQQKARRKSGIGTGVTGHFGTPHAV